MSVTTIISGGRSAINLKYESTALPVAQSVVPWASPNTLIFTALRYTLDSTDKAQGTVVGLTQGGLYGQYFSGDWRGTISTGNIGTLPLSAPTLYTSISYGSRADYYGFIAIGYFMPPTTGTYNFWTSSDDGSGVWIGDIASASSGRTTANAVVNNNMGGGQGDTKRGGSISLTAGQAYPIRIVHEEGGGGDNLTFSWSGPGISETTNLAQYFYYYQSGTNYAATLPVVGLTELNTYTTTYNNNPSAPTIMYRQVTSVTSQRAVRYNPLETFSKTVLVNSGTVPYNMAQLRIRDNTVTMVEFQASRTIDSAVVSNGGGNVVTTPAERQVWY